MQAEITKGCKICENSGCAVKEFTNMVKKLRSFLIRALIGAFMFFILTFIITLIARAFSLDNTLVILLSFSIGAINACLYPLLLNNLDDKKVN